MCADCRGITLLNVTFEVLPSLIQKRLSEMVEHNVHEYQMGFRPSRSTMENIHTVRQYEKCYIIKWTYIIYLLMTNRLLTV